MNDSIIPSSELILNADGSVYHLGLRPEHLADIIITVGDPERVAAVSRHFDRVDFRIGKREFISHGGELSGRRILVISSGIGTDNVEILLTELDALANIDLLSRRAKAEHRSLKVIRIGTSGALQEDVPLNALLISDYAFGLDTLMQFYDPPAGVIYPVAGQALRQHTGLEFSPYCARASDALKEQFADKMIFGNTVTCPGFYAPQGRQIRNRIRPGGLLDRLHDFRFEGGRLTNFEMETAAYYALGAMLGHQMLSTNAIMANRRTHHFTDSPAQTVELLIRTVLEKIVLL